LPAGNFIIEVSSTEAIPEAFLLVDLATGGQQLTLKATSPARELLIPPLMSRKGDIHDLVVYNPNPHPLEVLIQPRNEYGDAIGTGRTVLIDAGATQTVLLEGESDSPGLETIASVRLSSSELIVAASYLLSGQVVADAAMAVRTQVGPTVAATSHFEFVSMEYANDASPLLAIFNPTSSSAAIKVQCDGQVVIGAYPVEPFGARVIDSRSFCANLDRLALDSNSPVLIRTAGSNVQPTSSPAKSAPPPRQSTAGNERSACSADTGNADDITNLVPYKGDYSAPTDKIPLILVHGITDVEDTNGNCVLDTSEATAQQGGWGGEQGFLAYFDRTPELNSKYKIYIFSYLSNRENLFWLALSMGKRMDSFIQNGWMRDSKMVMIAYSMGGLVSRLYLNNITVHEGQYNGQKAGERVLRLITLATPHHGSPISNGEIRFMGNTNWLSSWDEVVKSGDSFYWGTRGCIACISDQSKSNRADLRYDNVLGWWPTSVYNNAKERNWLLLDSMRHEYDNAVIAYSGTMDEPPSDIKYLSDADPGNLLLAIAARAVFGLTEQMYRALGTLLDRVMLGNFAVPAGFSQLYNDGVVPAHSGSFTHATVFERVACRNRTHSSIKQDGGSLCEDGLQVFPGVKNRLMAALPLNQSKILTANPSASLVFGNITVNTGSTLNVTLQNTGNTTFSINSLQITGSDSAMFSLVAPPALPFNLQPGAATQIAVRFMPTSVGSRSATVSFGNDSSNVSPKLDIGLSGSGVQGAAPPATPAMISPGTSTAPGQQVASTTPTFSWKASTGATSYGLYISQSPYGQANLVYSNANVGNVTSFAIPSGLLIDNGQYRWSMTATGTAGTSDPASSPRLYFQVKAGTAAPTITAVSPAGLLSSTSPQNITLTGTGFSTGSTVAFDLPNKTVVMVASSQFLSLTPTSITLPVTLSVSGDWSVTYFSGSNQSSNSYPFPVTAPQQKPGAFTLTGDPATCNPPPSLSPLLRIFWTTSAQATSYDIYRNSYPAANVPAGTNAWVDPANLGDGQTYTYFVVANNQQGSTQSNSVSTYVPSTVCYTQPAGRLVVNATSYSPAFTQGQDSTSVALPITNDTGTPMRGTATTSTQSGGSWLTVAGSTAYTWTLPATLTVTFNPIGLAPGVYTGSITLSSQQASNSPVVIPVTMRISAPLVITTPPGLPDAFAGQPYSVTLQATGGSSYVWKLEDGQLPIGLTLNSSTGVISGTPSSISGTVNTWANISVNDGRYVWQRFTINWRQGIVISPPINGTPQWSVGTPIWNSSGFEFTASGGTAPYVWSATGLPPGVSINSSGTLSGTPTAGGSYPVRFSVVDSVGLTGSLNITLKVFRIPLVIYDSLNNSPPSIPNGVVGVISPANYYFHAQGGSQSGYQWSVNGSLPPGVAATMGTGCTQCPLYFAGTPTTRGVFPLTVTVTDSSGDSLSTYAVFVVNNPGPAPQIAAANLTLATIGIPSSSSFSATGGTGAVAWKIDGDLPDPNMSLSAGGVLTTTPTVPNDCRSGPNAFMPPQYPASKIFFVQATDAAGQVDVRQFCLPIYFPTPQIDSITPSVITPDGTTKTVTVEGRGFQAKSQLQFWNAPEPSTFVSPSTVQFSLPPSKWYALSTPDGASGLDAGTPIEISFRTPYTMPSNKSAFSIVLPPPGLSGVVPHLYNSARPCVPNMNCGLDLTGSGMFKQTTYKVLGNSQYIDYLNVPSQFAPWSQVTTSSFSVPAPGTYTIQVTNPFQADGGSSTASATFEVVANGAIVPTPTNFKPKFTVGDSASASNLSINLAMPDGTQGVATTSGGNWLTLNGQPSLAWTAPQTLSVRFDPTGLAAGTYNGSITLTSAPAPNSGLVVPVSMEIFAPLSISTASALPDAFGGHSYSVTLQATGGTGLTWQVQNGSSLPTGLTLNSSTGVISGTPGGIGSAIPKSFTIVVLDSLARTTTRAFSLTWRPGVVVNTPATGTPEWVVGSSIQAVPANTFLASGGTPPYLWTATGLPPGAVLNSAGVFSGTPTKAGVYTTVLTATDSGGRSAALSVYLTVTQIPLKIVDVTFGNNPPVLPPGIVGVEYQPIFLRGSGGSQAGYQWTITGSLAPGIVAGPPSGCTPPGCTLEFSGTPTRAGVYPISLKLADSGGNSLTMSLSLTINIATQSGFTISGNAGVAGATMTLTGSSTASITADGSGAYTFSNLSAAGNYTVTPTLANYSFTPANAVFANLQANQTANFTATILTYSITGKITKSSVGLAGVTVTLTGGPGGTRTSDGSGNYSFTSLPAGGNYILTPTLASHTFTPPNSTFNNLQTNQTANFTASLGSAPSSVSVSPNSGTGGKQVYQFKSSDPNGAGDIYYAQFNFSNPMGAVNSCYIHHDPATNAFYLLNDDASGWFGLIGGAGKVSNSQCLLDGVGTGSTKSGNDLTTTLNLSFRTSFSGSKNVYLYTADKEDNATGWVQVGTWTPTGDNNLTEVVSVLPNSGSASSQVFTLRLRDGDGAANIWWNQISINAGLNGYNGCYIHHDPANNVFYLLNDAATEWYGLFGATGGIVQNSQCILRGAGSSRTLSGTDLVVTYDLQFKTGFKGVKDVYVQGSDLQGNMQPWKRMGGWTVP
jgi:hypothetical protein